MSRGWAQEDRGHGGSGRMVRLSLSGRKIGEEGLIVDFCWRGKNSTPLHGRFSIYKDLRIRTHSGTASLFS